MAQQNFAFYKYVDENDNVYKIRASTAVVGAQPTTAVQTGIAGKSSVRTSRGNAGNGVRPRAIRLRRSAGTAPNTKVYYTKLPVFVKADVPTLLEGGNITLDGVAWTPDSLVPESVR
jgi:hypothetical protein